MNHSLLEAFGDRVVLRYDKAYLDAMLRTDSGLFIPEKGLKGQLLRQGELKAEVAVVVSKGEKVDDMVSVGDTVAVNYQIAFDQTNGGERTLNGNYLCTDEDGNEYRWATKKDIYAVVVKDPDGNVMDFIALPGHVFCEAPPEKPEEKTEGGIILAAQKQDTEKLFVTRVVEINAADTELLDIFAGDQIVCKGNTDVPIRIFNKRLIRIPKPADNIYGVLPVATASADVLDEW